MLKILYPFNDRGFFRGDYNRAPLLKQALASLTAQTARGFSISVYDNASADNTREIVEAAGRKFSGTLKYVRHENNIGADANFHAALDGASKAYTMLFHDDDMLHPKYIEYAIAAINKFGNVAIAASNYSYRHIESEENPHWQEVKRKAYFFKNQEDFAAYIFCDGRASFSSSIYRTADLRKYNRPNVYGKIGDTPVMMDTARGGRAVVLADKNIFLYRIHNGQDSKNASNGPLREEIVNRNRLFKRILMGGTAAHKILYKLSYAEWLSRHIKFAGADDSAKRAFLKSLKKDETAGLMSKLYALPQIGEIMRGIVRILRMSRKLIWRPQSF